MSYPLPVVKVSTASDEYAGKLDAGKTAFLRMHDIWLNGSATVGRVCLAISAKTGLADSSTGTIGGVSQNQFIGLAQGDTGAAYVPPIMTSDVFDFSSEGRNMIGVSSRVGLSYTNYKSSNQLVRWNGEIPRLRFDATKHGGLGSSFVSSDLSFAWSEFTGTPETGSDTTFNVTYVTAHFRRIDATSFGVRVVCGRGNQPANTGSMDFANGQTPAQVAATCLARADGSSPYAYNSGYPEWVVTSGDDPSAIFAEYPVFVFHNPLPSATYILHAECYASL